jgi:HD-like signal output (HDOD) protein
MEKLKDYAEVVSRAERGELVFPTSVNAALRLQLALADPDCEMEDVIRKVLAEPQLAARTVALSNAAAFNRSNSPVTNVRVGAAAGFPPSVFDGRFDGGAPVWQPHQRSELRAKADQLWQHTAHVAALSYIIGRKLTHTDPDTALFAAIVHEAGGFYLLSCADELPGLLEHPEQWQGAAQEIITREMMKKMAIPEPVSQAIVACVAPA